MAGLLGFSIGWGFCIFVYLVFRCFGVDLLERSGEWNGVKLDQVVSPITPALEEALSKQP